MPNVPAVSVVLTVYNRARFAAEAIDSILAQTLADFELIIVDDGSSDNSPKVIADYAKRDSRIVVVSQNNAGLSAARNAGAKKARAELIAFMDDDDHSLPTRLEKQAAFLNSHPDVDCCISWISQMDESGNLIRAAYLANPLPSFFGKFDSPVHHIGAQGMIRKRAFWELAGFREWFRMVEDSDFTIRFWELRLVLGVVGEDLYRWRIYRGGAGTSLTSGWPSLGFKYLATVLISANCRRAEKEDPIDKNPPLDEVMNLLSDLPESARVYLMHKARNCARRILRDSAGEEGGSAEFWEMVGYVSEISLGLESQANSIFRWLLWQSLRYGRFSIGARLIKNFLFV